MKIQTSFSFAAAHKLEDYEGDCARLHGHNYKVIIEAERDKVDERGFIVDFKKLKDMVNNILDHKTILKDTSQNRKDFSFMLPEIFFMRANPTAENISEIIKQSAIYEYAGTIFKVTVYETDNNFAVSE